MNVDLLMRSLYISLIEKILSVDINQHGVEDLTPTQ